MKIMKDLNFTIVLSILIGALYTLNLLQDYRMAKLELLVINQGELLLAVAKHNAIDSNLTKKTTTK